MTSPLRVSQRRSVLLFGHSGVGKTSAALQVLCSQEASTTLTKRLFFSSATTPLLFYSMVEGCVEKRQGRTFGPAGGKRMVLLIDDFSSPRKDAWGAQPTLEAVRQLVEWSGMLNLSKPGEWKAVVDLSLVCAMLSPSSIPSRASRHFHLLLSALPSISSISHIFCSLLSAVFSDLSVPAEVARAARDRLVPMTLDVWQRSQARLLPTPRKPHYSFVRPTAPSFPNAHHPPHPLPHQPLAPSFQV